MSMNHKDDEIELLDIDLDYGEGTPHDEASLNEEENVIEPAQEQEKSSKGAAYVLREIFSYVVIIVIAIAASLAINRFIIVNANVPSRSMAPTINAGDKLFGYRLAYMFSEPERGDIVIFDHQCYADSKEETLIKRVIGVPGDYVEIVDGVMYINGEIIEEDYLAEPVIGNYGPFEVPEDSYLMMGDNRKLSDDARFWDNTYVHRDAILAKAIFKYSPKWEIIE